MKKDLSQSVLDQIKKDHICPRPRWHYMLKDGIFWFIFFASVLLGSIGIAVIIYAFFDTDFDLLSYVPTNRMGHFLQMIPIYWIGLFTIFAGLAVWGAQHTKKGYRYSVLWILVINLMISSVFGGMIYFSGGSERMERIFSRGMPFYKHFKDRREHLWKKVGEGLLGGEIIELRENKILLLNDLDQKEWEVDYAAVKFRRPIELKTGMRVRMLGKKLSDNRFKAERIRPWRNPNHKRTKFMKRFKDQKYFFKELNDH